MKTSLRPAPDTPAAWRALLAGAARAPRRAASVCAGASILGTLLIAGAIALAAEAHMAGTGIDIAMLAALTGAGLALRLLGTAGQEHFLEAAQFVVRGKARRSLLALLLNGDLARDAALARYLDDARAIAGYLTRFAHAKQLSMIQPLVLVLAAIALQPVMGLALGACLVGMILGLALAGLGTARTAKDQLVQFERLSNLFGDRLRHLALIRQYQAGPQVAETLRERAESFRGSVMAVLRRAFLSTAVQDLAMLVTLGLLAMVFLARMQADATSARGIAVFFLATEIFLSYRALSAVYQERQLGEAALQRAAALAEQTRALPQRPREPLRGAPQITFRGVIAAQGDEGLALPDFIVPRGEVTALIGPSGVGKTTALHALVGLVPLRSGVIEIDGKPVPSPWLSVGWISQRPALLSGTVGDNLRFFAPEGRRTDSDLEEALRAAGAMTFLSGLDQRLGEDGLGLSGGQAQRIALARALLSDAPLIVMDEPTAALDMETEAAFLHSARSALAGRTVLIASHSAALRDWADHVIDWTGRA